MNTSSELTRLLAETEPLKVTKRFKGVVFSDTHLGTKGLNDDFCPNELLFNTTFDRYVNQEFQPIFLGDIEDLWENPNRQAIREAYPSVFRRIDGCLRVKGNHDEELPFPEAIVLQYVESGKRLLLVHGHQGDFWNASSGKVSRWVVRHIWRNLQLVGLKDPTTAIQGRNPKKHEAVKREIDEWSLENHQTVVFGHSHLAEERLPYYFNCGSWVAKGAGQCVEIVGEEISVKSFTE